MRYLSLFSGIEAATVAWHPLGWECAAVAEVEPFPCKVLAHHYPNVPNLGDVTKITKEQIEVLGHIDVIVFGSPCQDLSVAGHRKGLLNADGTVTRSGLFFTAINIARWSGARFWLWENVPGAYSSSKGRDFASVVEFMAGLDSVEVPPRGWATEGVAVGDNGLLEWGTLDAQWFGVAQRRRRVFALLDTGDWTSRPPLLLEPEGMRGDSAPSREARQDVALTVGTGAPFSRTGNQRVECDAIVPISSETTGTFKLIAFSSTYDMKQHHNPQPSDTVQLTTLNNAFVRGDTPLIAFPANLSGTQVATSENLCPSMGAKNPVAVAYVGGVDYENNGHTMDEPTGPLLKGSPTGGGRPLPAIATSMQVRRLTPTECERLQGFPDSYTDIKPNGKPTPDGPRYKALGNSMAVPVMRWIGSQIDKAVAWQTQ